MSAGLSLLSNSDADAEESDTRKEISFSTELGDIETYPVASYGTYIRDTDGSIVGYYSGIATAIQEISEGQTVVLRRQFGTATIKDTSIPSGVLSIEIDLNGFTIGGVNNTSSSSTVVRNGTFDGYGSSASLQYIRQQGPGSTAFEDVVFDYSTKSWTSTSAPINVSAGTLDLGSSDITLAAMQSVAYGVQATGGTLRYSGKLSVTRPSTNTTTYGYMAAIYAQKASVELEDADIGVEIASGNRTGVYALQMYNNVTVNASRSKFSVSAADDAEYTADSAYALFAAQPSNLNAHFDSCSFVENVSKAAARYAIYGLLNSQGYYSNTFELDGVTTLSSTSSVADLSLFGILSLGKNFSSPGKIRTLFQQTTVSTLAKASDDDGQLTEEQLTLFSAIFNDVQAHLVLSDDAKNIAVDRDNVAQVYAADGTAGRYYDSLPLAIAGAEEHGTVRIVSTDAVSSADEITVNKSIEIDLDGREVSTGRIFVTSGNLVVKDSSEAKGRLSIADDTGAGILLSSAESSLLIDDATVLVESAHKGNASGVLINSARATGDTSQVVLQNSASLSVSSEVATQAHAINIAGFESLESPASATVSIDSTSSVVVSNNNKSRTASSDGSGTNVYNISEISVDAGSSLYAAIAEKFYDSARYDTDSNTWKAGNMLVDGRYYYAESAEVKTEADGSSDEVAPARIWKRSSTQSSNLAAGITVADSASTSLSISGSVFASSAIGDASAVNAVGSADVTIGDGASLTSSTDGEGSYRVASGDTLTIPSTSGISAGNGSGHAIVVNKPVEAVALSLSKGSSLFVDGSVKIKAFSDEARVVDIQSDTFSVGDSFDPIDKTLSVMSASGFNADATIVMLLPEETSVSDGRAIADFIVDSEGKLSASYDVDSHSIIWTNVTQIVSRLTVSGAYDANGEEFSMGGYVPVGETLETAVEAGTLIFSKPADYVTDEGGTVVRHIFVGWNDGTTNLFGTTYGASLSTDFALGRTAEANSSETAGKSYELNAVYAEVAAGQHLITFTTGTRTWYQVVADGETPDFENKTGYSKNTYGAYDTVPAGATNDNGEDGVTYAFAGWRRNGEGDAIASSDIPAPNSEDSDVNYVASWTEGDVGITLHYMGGDATWTQNADTGGKVVATTEELASWISELGIKSFVHKGTVYKFLGWSTSSDATNLKGNVKYAADEVLPLVDSTATTAYRQTGGVYRSLTQYYAVYRKSAQTVDVNFVVDGEVYATASDVDVATSVADAFEASGVSAPSANMASGTVFRRWSDAAEDGSTSQTLSLLDLFDPAYGTESVTLYAVYDETAAGTEELAISALDAQLTLAKSEYAAGNYTDGQLAAVQAAYDAAVEAVKGASGSDAKKAALASGLESMASVETASSLSSARASLSAQLASVYTAYDRSNYTSDNLAALESAYEAAVKAVSEAASANAANEAATAGLAAMASVKAGIPTVSAAAKAQSIKLAKKTVTVKKGKSKTVKVTKAKGKIVAKASGSKAKKALKVSVKAGKVVVKAKKGAKKGTYKVKVYAKAASGYAKSKTVTLKVKVK